MMRRRSPLLVPFFVSVVIVPVTAAGCAQVLGIDDRSVGPDGGTQGDATTKTDGREKTDAPARVDGKSKTDATSKTDGGAQLDASDGGHPVDAPATSDHHVADVGTSGDSGADSGAPHDASDAAPDTGLTTCDGGAFNLETDPSHCGTCSHDCPSPEAGLHNEQATCVSGACGTGCTSGYGNCDDGGAGCTVNLSILPANCGSCGNVCGNAQTSAAPTCVSGACVFQCNPGFAHCGTNDLDGCGTDIESDTSNCGTCGYSCGPGATTCSGGACVLSTTEQLSTQLGMSSVVQDSTMAAASSLYWVSGTSPNRTLRTIHKDGSGLTSIATTSPPSGESVSVDANNVYYFGSGQTLDEVSTAGTSGTNIPVPGFMAVNSTPQGVVCDGDRTHPATTVFFAESSSGLYRVALPPNGTQQTYLADAWPIQGMALWGPTLYFAAGQPGGTTYLEYATTTQTTALTPMLATFSAGDMMQGATSIATDGVNVYVMSVNPPNIYAVAIPGGNVTVLASNGPGQYGYLVTDGTNVYVGNSNIYRVPVTSMNVALGAANQIFAVSALGTGNVTGMQVDDTNLYFSTSSGIFMIKK